MGDERNSLQEGRPSAALGLSVSAGAMLVAAWTLLQVEVLPLGTVRTGWWPACAGGLLLLGAWLFPAEGSAAFRLRMSALVVFGLAPFWQGLAVSQRTLQQPVGFHRAFCMLACLAAFAVHNLEMCDAMRLAARRRGLCQRLEHAFWRLTGVLFLETLAVCQLLVLVIQGEFRWRLLPDALVQCLVGPGPVPKFTGWLFCAACALSALSRLGQAAVCVRTNEARKNDDGKQDRDDRGPGLPGDGAGDGACGTAG